MISFPLHFPRLSEPDRRLAAPSLRLTGGVSPPDAALAPMPRTDGGAHVVGRRSLFEPIEWLNPRELKVN